MRSYISNQTLLKLQTKLFAGEMTGGEYVAAVAIAETEAIPENQALYIQSTFDDCRLGGPFYGPAGYVQAMKMAQEIGEIFHITDEDISDDSYTPLTPAQLLAGADPEDVLDLDYDRAVIYPAGVSTV